MLAAETYRQRLETTGLNFVEFNYRLVQAYDFLHLFRTEGCTLADGRLRPVGQHRRRRRPDPARRRRAGLRPRLPAADDRLRREDGQERGQLGLARPGADHARTTSTSTGSTSTTPTSRASCGSTPSCRRRGSPELTAVEGAALREAKQVLACEVTALTHGEEAVANAEAATRALFGGAPDHDDPNIPTTEIAAT